MSEGELKKRFDEITLKGYLDPNDVGKDLENLLDEVKQAFPDLNPKLLHGKTEKEDLITITPEELYKLRSWVHKWFGDMNGSNSC